MAVDDLHEGKLLGGACVQEFQIDLARFIETRGWLVLQDFSQTERLAAQIATLAGESLSKRWKKVAKRAHGLATLTAEERHELRKELKKLRYAVEFFCSLFPAKRVGSFLKHLKQLQTVFGDLNDAATMKAMFTGTDISGAGDPSVQRCHWLDDRGESGVRRVWLDRRQGALERPRADASVLGMTRSQTTS